MAFYLLHNILFPATKLANQHLLLDEFHHMQWTRAGNLSSSPEAFSSKTTKQTSDGPDSVSIHTILFGVSLVNFAFSHRCLAGWLDHRRYLPNLLVTLLVSLSGYLYTANTIASLRRADPSWSQAGPLYCVHGTILLVSLAVLQWSQFMIGSICDTLSVRASSLEASKLEKCSTPAVSNRFVSQLMAGSLSVALMSFSLFELFIKHQSSTGNQIGYTNIVLVMAILSTLLELACLKLLPAGQEQRQATGKEMVVHSAVDNNEMVNVADLFGGTKATRPMESDRKSLPSSIWSISSRNGRKNSETTHSTDDDEFDNSAISYRTCLDFQLSSEAQLREANQRQQIIWLDMGAGDVELFDRSKYSLYEDQVDDERNSPGEQVRTVESANQQQQQRQQQPHKHHENLPNHQGHLSASVLDALLLGDLPFVWQSMALILIGTIYQANQLCYFSEYISYLLFDSPWQFRWSIRTGAGSLLVPPQSVHSDCSGQVLNATWIGLVCISVLAQSTARIVGLQYANHMLISLGTRRLFWLLLLIALTIPVQFMINYHLIETSYVMISLRTRTFLILGHMLTIQLVVGLIGALVDFIINGLALNYSQYLGANWKLPAGSSSDAGVQCTIHGLLNGAFLYLGAAAMSAIRMLADNARRNSSLVIVPIAFIPTMILLVMVALFGLHTWNLRRSLKAI